MVKSRKLYYIKTLHNNDNKLSQFKAVTSESPTSFMLKSDSSKLQNFYPNKQKLGYPNIQT